MLDKCVSGGVGGGAQEYDPPGSPEAGVMMMIDFIITLGEIV